MTTAGQYGRNANIVWETLADKIIDSQGKRSTTPLVHVRLRHNKKCMEDAPVEVVRVVKLDGDDIRGQLLIKELEKAAVFTTRHEADH
jgi:hypothetical protein